MGRGRSGSSGRSRGKGSGLFRPNRVYHYEDDPVSEEVMKAVSMSPKEYLASLSTDERCRFFLQLYEQFVASSCTYLDDLADSRRKILDTCPEWGAKAMEKIDNSRSKLIAEGKVKLQKKFLEQAPLDTRCRGLTLAYEQNAFLKLYAKLMIIVPSSPVKVLNLHPKSSVFRRKPVKDIVGDDCSNPFATNTIR